MKRYLSIIGLFIVSIAFTGCSRAISEGVHGVMGSSGKIVKIQGDDTRIGQITRDYGAVSVEPFGNDVGQVVPQPFLEVVHTVIENKLQLRDRSAMETVKFKKKEDLGPFFTGPADKKLIIRGKVIQYDQGDLKDKAMSPMDEAICRVQFVDGTSGEMIAEANCTGRSKSVVRTGPNELADGVAKGIKKFLAPPKEKKSDESK